VSTRDPYWSCLSERREGKRRKEGRTNGKQTDVHHPKWWRYKGKSNWKKTESTVKSAGTHHRLAAELRKGKKTEKESSKLNLVVYFVDRLNEGKRKADRKMAHLDLREDGGVPEEGKVRRPEGEDRRGKRGSDSERVVKTNLETTQVEEVGKRVRVEKTKTERLRRIRLHLHRRNRRYKRTLTRRGGGK